MNRLRFLAPLALVLAVLPALPLACSSDDDASTEDGGADGGTGLPSADAQQPPSTADAAHDGGVNVVVEAGPLPPSTFCSLPGSLSFTATGTSLVSGGPSKSLGWMTLPAGYCVHYFGNVGNARQLRFSPTGDLFVASPTQGTTGGGASGLAAIAVLPDDGHDGTADGVLTFLGSLPATQGMLFANGSFYFQATDPANTQGQVGTLIRQMPYTSGSRSGDVSTATTVASIDMYYSPTHWPKTLDQADDGTIYVGNGGDQGETCDPSVFPRPFHGGILKLDPEVDGGVDEVAMGFRNPVDIKCQKGHDRCFSTELSLDYSGADDGREKLVTIHQGDDWGFPCCATANTKYGTVSGSPDCSQVQADTNSFIIGDTPFGFDFMPASWAGGTYGGRVVVALHGVFGSWQGARVVAIALDPTTGLPLPTTDLGSGTPATLADFLTGFDDNMHDHGRPSDVTFAADGRMFVSDDDDGDIFWVAPVDLANPYTTYAAGDGGGG
jgi:glucose/arabinose dehydrogenase